MLQIPQVPNINLYNADCMEFMRGLPDKAYELAIVDPQYGIGASKPSVKPSFTLQKNGNLLAVKSFKSKMKDWDSEPPKAEYFTEVKRVSERQIIWGANYFGLTGGMLVWDKLNGESDQYDAEIALLSWTNEVRTVYYMWSGMFQGEVCSSNVREALRQRGNKSKNEERIHETQKPVPLYKWLLTNYAKPGDKILDTHGGSMSIAIACYDLGFDLDLCELDADYFAAGKKRFEDHVSKYAPASEIPINSYGQAKLF